MSESADIRLRLTPLQRRAIERLALRSQVSVEQAILQAVEQVLAAESEQSSFPRGTPLHGLDDLLSELGEGPPDLSSSRAYLDDLGL